LKLKEGELLNREPQPGAEGKIAFLHPRTAHGVLIELVEVESDR